MQQTTGFVPRNFGGVVGRGDTVYLKNHCIIKLNSKIAFDRNPDLLKEYTIELIDFNDDNALEVSDFLVRHGFTNLEIDSMQENEAIMGFFTAFAQEELDTSTGKMFEDRTEWLRFIQARYEGDYIKFEFSDSLLKEIRKHPLIDTAYIMDIYTGEHEYEKFLEIKNNHR